MINILDSYLPKYIVDLHRENEDTITVRTRRFSQDGDEYELDIRTVQPNALQTSQSLNELRPEVSDTYPFKVVTPIDFDGATLIYGPSANTFPTASQHYYVPTYFERLTYDIMKLVDKGFYELEMEPLSELSSRAIELAIDESQ